MKDPHQTSEGGGQNSTGGASSIVPLADRINALHRETQEHRTQALLKARVAGVLLLEAKDTVKHGEWLDWLEANFAGSGRTARAYMRIAARWEVLEAEWQSTANLPLSEALKLVRYGYVKGGRA